MRAKLTLVALPFLLALVVAGDPPAAEGDAAIVATIEKGRDAFKAGKHQEAIEKPPEGDRAHPGDRVQGARRVPPRARRGAVGDGRGRHPERQLGSGESSFQWTQVSRRYTKKGEENGPRSTS